MVRSPIDAFTLPRSRVRFSPKRWLLPLAVAAVLLPATAGAVMLADSTTVERWTLPNGLTVVTRDVPGAPAVSVALGFRGGSDADPREAPGLADLLAEVAFTAPAGDIPARTREDMDTVRPLGWAVRVNPQTTVLMEAATHAQAAGVLHQMAVRLRGVTVNDQGLKQAFATTRKELGDRAFGDLSQMVYTQVRDVARGIGPQAALNRASGRALERLGVRQVQNALAARYVPSNAVLSIAGDLSGLDLATLVRAEFGPIPGGTPPALPPPARLDSAGVQLRRAGLAEPIGAVGVLAPALTDSLYPSFYLAMVMVATHTTRIWGPPAPLPSRFQFSVLDDPALARFYPRLDKDHATLHALGEEFANSMDEVMELTITSDAIWTVGQSVMWLFGGPMPSSLRRHVQQDAPALNQIAVADAQRALLGSEAFWAEFRARLDPLRSPGPSTWNSYLSNPAHLSRLLLVTQ